MLGLYLHVPFCGKKCDYCDFSAIQAPESLYTEYLELISAEILHFAEQQPGVLSKVETLYVGGGTPSVLPPDLLVRLFQILQEAGVPLHSLKESTMEFNPESCDHHRLSVIREFGVNRVSLGIQTFQEDLLRCIGRSHKAGDGSEALNLLTSMPGLRVSADLMFNLPGQTLECFVGDLDRLSDYPLGHVSFYGLKVDPKSRLGHRIARGELFVDEDLYAPMYREGVALLASKGFERYETSNFARTGEQSLHNLNYWRRGEYLAFGPGAHGYWGGERFYAPEMYARWREYVREGMPREMLEIDPIGDSEILAETIQLSLRTRFGLDLANLQKMGWKIPGKNIEKWVKQGYAALNGDYFVLVGDGWLFMDRVVEDLFCDCKPYSNLE